MYVLEIANKKNLSLGEVFVLEPWTMLELSLFTERLAVNMRLEIPTLLYAPTFGEDAKASEAAGKVIQLFRGLYGLEMFYPQTNQMYLGQQWLKLQREKVEETYYILVSRISLHGKVRLNTFEASKHGPKTFADLLRLTRQVK
jgi:hypothetical protein